MCLSVNSRKRNLGELYGKLSGLMQMTCPEDSDNQEKNEESSNSIRIYRLCGRCVEQIRVIGVEKQREEESDIIII